MKTIILSLALCALSACIIVEDYGDSWNTATDDPCINLIVEKHYGKSFEDDKPPYLAKRMTLGDQHLLLIKSNEKSAGGHAYRFALEGNIFIGYKPNPAMLKTFHKNYKNAPASVTKDKAILKKLGEEEQAFLQTILADDTYWMADVKTLYNPLRNKQCSLYIPTDDDDKEK